MSEETVALEDLCDLLKMLMRQVTAVDERRI
jgi:hypothetical protein